MTNSAGSAYIIIGEMRLHFASLKNKYKSQPPDILASDS